MTTMVLSQATQAAIQTAINAGPGANNQNYLAAYTAIYKDIAANDAFNTGTVKWFQQAGQVNTQAFNPNAAGTYIWNYTTAAAKSEGVTLSQSVIFTLNTRVKVLLV
jgi:hypothetical protein